jgi:hypothetical protein
MDTTALESAYRRLLDVAGTGGFRPPADTGTWSAELRLAHVVATDRLLAVATVGVLEGRSVRYDNSAAGNRHWLAVIGRAAGGHEALIAAVRQSGLELVLLARRLEPAHETTAVPTRIVDADVVRVDAPLPWVATLRTHAEVHLAEQIAALEALAR